VVTPAAAPAAEQPGSSVDTPSEAPAAPDEPPGWATDEPAPPADVAPEPAPRAGPGAVAAARAGIQQTRQAGDDRPGGSSRYDADADAHPDDVDADNQGLDSAELLRRELGARVIDEIPNP
jgi:DNA polymerase-3 subunit gamma/tau